MKTMIISILSFLIFILGCTEDQPVENKRINLTLLSPNGGEYYQISDTLNVIWAFSNISWVNILLSYNKGYVWKDSIVKIDASLHEFKFTDLESGSDSCLIKIENYSDNSVFDVSDNIFTILASSDETFLEIITPNGNELYSNIEIIDISWESTNVPSYDIYISYDNGIEWDTIVEGLDSTNKSYSYSISDTGSYYCMVKITDSENPNVFDTSDSTFVIVNLDEAKEFYQLQVGNMWVYEKNNGSNISYEKREIVGDTTINNRTYFKMSINISPNYFKYFRVSEHGDFIEYRVDREFVILDFSSPPGRYQINEAVVIIRGDTSKTFFNKLYNVKWQYFQYGSGFGSETYDEFANGLGKTIEHFATLSSFTDYALKGAVINQIVYGDTTYSNN